MIAGQLIDGAAHVNGHAEAKARAMTHLLDHIVIASVVFDSRHLPQKVLGIACYVHLPCLHVPVIFSFAGQDEISAFFRFLIPEFRLSLQARHLEQPIIEVGDLIPKDRLSF